MTVAEERARPAPRESAGPALPRALSLGIGLAAAVLVAAGLRAGASILAPVVLALVLTVAVMPLASWAQRRGWPSWSGALLCLVASCAILVVLVLGSALAVVKLVELLPQYADRADELRSQLEGWLTGHGVGAAPVDSAVPHLDPAALTSTLTGLLSGVLGALGDLFLLVTLLFFFSSAVPLLGARVGALTRAKPDLARSLRRFVDATQRYLVVTALFGAIVAVVDTGALWLLGVPLPLVWGLFSFLTNFVPNIGFVVGVIPPALLALLGDGWAKALTVVVVYSVINVVIQTFIQPHYVASTVGLSAEVTFLSLVVWTFLLGPLGALLAVPMTLLTRALLVDADPRAAWVSPLISTSAASPDG